MPELHKPGQARHVGGIAIMDMPRVTSILSPYQDFSGIPPETLAAAAERGTNLHKACAAYALGLYYPVSGDIAGFYESFKAWFNNYVVEVLAVEEEVIHPAWRYVGHVDLIAKVAGIRPNQAVAVIDYKSPAVASRGWNCQVAAYLEASKDKYGAEIAGALQLKKDGSLPRMIWIENPAQAFNAFVGMLNGFNYMKGGGN
jgi:hypothetical protein